MLREDDKRGFVWEYESWAFGGNRQWAEPEEAISVGERVGEELFDRFVGEDRDYGDSPEVRDSAHRVLDTALEVVDYAALPTERRANILRGVINTLESTGALGGRPEWAKVQPRERMFGNNLRHAISTIRNLRNRRLRSANPTA